MFGLNPKLPVERGDGSILKITSIFMTLQGEGPYVGHPSIFIRTSGCNLACEFCDTEFDSYEELSTDSIIKKITSFPHKPLIVITGGEPMRQNISVLCHTLIAMGYTVQIESNGILCCKNLPHDVKIVCSPKISNGKYHMIRDDILQKTIAIKFIVSASTKYRVYSDIAEVGQTKHHIPVYVQPMDEYCSQSNENNLKLAIELAFQHNAILSMQTHKIIGIE